MYFLTDSGVAADAPVLMYSGDTLRASHQLRLALRQKASFSIGVKL